MKGTQAESVYSLRRHSEMSPQVQNSVIRFNSVLIDLSCHPADIISPQLCFQCRYLLLGTILSSEFKLLSLTSF